MQSLPLSVGVRRGEGKDSRELRSGDASKRGGGCMAQAGSISCSCPRYLMEGQSTSSRKFHGSPLLDRRPHPEGPEHGSENIGVSAADTPIFLETPSNTFLFEPHYIRDGLEVGPGEGRGLMTSPAGNR